MKARSSQALILLILINIRPELKCSPVRIDVLGG
jgi:hypothetical protein